MNKKRILLVEDEQIVAMNVRDKLELKNFEVLQIASSGKDAIEIAMNENPDLILMDIVLTGEMTGIEAAGIIQKELDIPIIYITANADKVNVQDAKGTFPYGFLNKPINIRDLYTNIDFVLNRHTLEKRIRESEESLKRIVKTAPMGLCQIDQDRVFKWVSDQMLEMVGYSEDELLGKSTRILYINDEDFERASKFMSSDKVESGIIVYETQWKRKDNSLFDALLRVGFDPEDFSKGATIAIMNVSEQKKTENEKNVMQAMLRQSQKMEAMGTLAGGIAHDFNNILNGILGYTELALNIASDNDRLRIYLNQILEASRRASELIKQILTFSRKKDIEKKPTNVEIIIDETIRLLKASISPSIKIKKVVSAKFDLIMADPTQVHQIIMNLCTNALHAMSEGGGVLSIKLEEYELNSDLASKIHDLNEGVYLKLQVADTGHGISPEIINRIFDPFFTTKQLGKGAGLGLSVIHGIVKENGGEIFVDSEVGKGTTFVIYFPLDKNIIGEGQVEKPLPLPRGNARILFVDDEAPLVELGKSMLEELGYSVVARTSSVEALEVFKNRPKSFDIVITDQIMPNMTGLNFAEELMKIRPDIPVILCTGFSENISSEKAMECGVREFLYKPISMREIAEALKAVLELEKDKNERRESHNNDDMAKLKGKKILIAEDLISSQNLMAIMLKNLGCKYEIASNGKEAVDYIKKDKFDLVLMDIKMPVMDGIEASRIIRNELKNGIPIIALSGLDVEKDKKEFKDTRVDDFLIKPISIDSLKKVLMQWIE
ncbi:response regulator [Spirochaetota bacterium]